MIDLSNYQEIIHQGSVEWYRARMGKFNASRISELMGKGKKKDEYWSKAALTYISEVAAERNVAKDVIENEDAFEEYLYLTNTENKYMRYGSEHEPEARDIYATKHGVEVTEVGSIQHPDLPGFSCSPDGLVVSTNSGIEIKCPLPKTYWLYRTEIHDAESLKAVKPEYYWQIMAQIAVCDLDYVDFVCYCEYMEKPLHEVRILRDDAAVAELIERVTNAEKYIEEKWK